METNFKSVVITNIKANKHEQYINYFIKKINNLYVYSSTFKSERDLTSMNGYPPNFFEVLENGGNIFHIVYDLDNKNLFYPFPSLKLSTIPKELEIILKEVVQDNKI